MSDDDIPDSRPDTSDLVEELETYRKALVAISNCGVCPTCKAITGDALRSYRRTASPTVEVTPKPARTLEEAIATVAIDQDSPVRTVCRGK